MRKPDEIIGSSDDPYMLRWILFRPGVSRFLRSWLPSLYLHQFVRSDDDRHFHDHVGWSISIVLRGGYWEVTPVAKQEMIDGHPHLVPSVHKRWRWRGPGSITLRRSTQPHFIALGRVVTQDRRGIITGSKASKRAFHDIPVMSLWIRGPWRREWGFYTQAGWIPWDKYSNLGPDVGYESKGP